MQTQQTTQKEVGYVVAAKDYLLTISGLPSSRINDIILTPSGARALVTSMEKNSLEALMLDEDRPKPGDIITKSEKNLSLPNPNHLLGRAINPLGQILDNKAPLPLDGITIDLDKTAPGIDTREVIGKQIITGITIIDTLLPIGRGQRELLLGESRSGKSSIMLDMIVHQKNQNTICIYTAIGRSDVDVQKFIKSLEENDAFDYTIVIAAKSSESAPLIYIAPSIACDIADYFRNKGLDVLLIMDDLGTHSKYLREIALLSGRIPGRESYPADIFYQHSHLVERAGNFNENLGGGSITLLPVVEVDMDNFTGLIPTNVMSMTDGHLFFSASLRSHGYYPSIEMDRSVTRVGRQTQPLIYKVLADRIRQLLANFHELEKYSRFGSELSPDSQLIIKRGSSVSLLLKQEPLQKIEYHIQLLLLALIFTGFFDSKELDFVLKNKEKIINVLSTNEFFKNFQEKIKKIDIDSLINEFKTNLNILENACASQANS